MSAPKTVRTAKSSGAGILLTAAQADLDDLRDWSDGLGGPDPVARLAQLQRELEEHRLEAAGYVQRGIAERQAAEAAAAAAVKEADRQAMLATLQAALETGRRKAVKDAVDLLGQERYPEFLEWLFALGDRGQQVREALTPAKGSLTEDEINYRRDGLLYLGPRLLLFHNNLD